MFDHIRNKKINILEIGVDKGASIKMWLDYFINAEVYGLDMLSLNSVELGINSPRFHLYQGKQADDKVLEKILEDCPEFDIIIDDGSHRPEDQQYTMAKLFPCVKERGYYVVEDLNYKCTSNTTKTVDIIKEFIDGKDFYDKYVQMNTDNVQLVCNDKLAFFKKKKERKITNEPEFISPDVRLLTEEEVLEKYKDTPDIPIQVTTTATMRPSIIERTFKSFVKNLKGVDWKNSTLFINVDPIPEGKRDKAVKVCNSLFGKVVHNFPKKASYSQAFNWCWSKASDEYILNLEDDWVLDKVVHIQEILSMFKLVPTLYQVVLRAYKYQYPACVTSPAILTKHFYKAFAGNLDPMINPENQLHTRGDQFGLLDIPFRKHRKNPAKRVQAYPTNGKEIIVIDIGREWMESTDLCRPDYKRNFTTWHKKPLEEQPSY